MVFWVAQFIHSLLGDSVWSFFYPKNINATYGNSELIRILEKQRHKRKGLVAIFTDIDRTFYHADREVASWQVTSMAKKIIGHSLLFLVVTIAVYYSVLKLANCHAFK